MGIPPIKRVQKPSPILDAVRKAREALLRNLKRKKAMPAKKVEPTAERKDPNDPRGRHFDRRV